MFIESTLTGVRAENARKMCEGRFGAYLGHPPEQPHSRYYVLDGKVWLIVPGVRSVRLGDYFVWCDEVRRGIRAVTRP